MINKQGLWSIQLSATKTILVSGVSNGMEEGPGGHLQSAASGLYIALVVRIPAVTEMT